MSGEQLISELKELLSAVEDGSHKLKIILSQLSISPFSDVPPNDARRARAIAEAVADDCPIQYALGHWCFMDFELSLGEGVLIPRDDTVALAESAIAFLQCREAPRVLELCAGSGAVAIAISRYCPAASVVAVEKYEAAYSYLLKNIQNNPCRVDPLLADAFGLERTLSDSSLDLIVCNPPYVSSEEYELLSREVKREPITALVPDGSPLMFYEYIAKNYKPCLKKGGGLMFEVGDDMSDAVSEILSGSGYADIKTLLDCFGAKRIVAATVS